YSPFTLYTASSLPSGSATLMQAPGRRSSIPPTTKVSVGLEGGAPSSVLVSNDCMGWMVTKHVLQNQNHKLPASFSRSRVPNLRGPFQLSPGCEILGPEEE